MCQNVFREKKKAKRQRDEAMHCITDFAYSGRPRVVAPFWKPDNKIMPGRTKLYNDIHSYYRGRGEHLFGLTHPFGLMRHSWDGCGATSHAKLLNCMRVLFGFLTVHLHRRIRYEVYGPWDHLPQDSTDVAEEQPADSARHPVFLLLLPTVARSWRGH